MDTPRSRKICPDCQPAGDRREFLGWAAGAAIATAGLPLLSRRSWAAPTKESPAEVAVKELFASLDDAQRKIVVLPLDDARRTRINANWNITEAEVGGFSDAQKDLIHRVVKGITSEDGYGRFIKQMSDDTDGVGIDAYAIAIFGDPNKEQFEFELTGRHLTLRADGNTLGAAAFGGPIVYGHGLAGNSDKNLFSYQTKRANEVFKALDEKQREKALLDKLPGETEVQFRKEGAEFLGISGKELSADQRALVEAVLRDILAPYRKEDVDEAMEVVKAGGGIEALSISFSKAGDLGGDKSWDVWRLEGPTLMTHFRGDPHVHAYINIAKQA
jgi:hypothetical protein